MSFFFLAHSVLMPTSYNFMPGKCDCFLDCKYISVLLDSVYL